MIASILLAKIKLKVLLQVFTTHKMATLAYEAFRDNFKHIFERKLKIQMISFLKKNITLQ